VRGRIELSAIPCGPRIAPFREPGQLHLVLSPPPLGRQPSPGRDSTENLMRTITCICDSYVATRGSVFGPTTLVTEPLSPLTP
jgi:hypothetical protein